MLNKIERQHLIGITLTMDKLLLHLNTLINNEEMNEEQAEAHIADTVKTFNDTAKFINELVRLNEPNLKDDYNKLKETRFNEIIEDKVNKFNKKK